MRHVFEAIHDYHAFRADHDDFTTPFSPPPLPRELVGVRVTRATILEPSEGTSPPDLTEILQTARQHPYKAASASIGNAPWQRTLVHWLHAFELETSFTPKGRQAAQVTVTVRPALSRQQLRYLPLHTEDLGQALGKIRHFLLPNYLPWADRVLRKITLADHADRHCGSSGYPRVARTPRVYQPHGPWTYHHPAGPYDYNARASRIIERNTPLAQLAYAFLWNWYGLRGVFRVEYTKPPRP
ncbi:MAG: hypothetical protein SFV54_25115 [Bryobacteraceae bacterium]|nr:hypothetical protein [Bryobacteraceae bacterium]